MDPIAKLITGFKAFRDGRFQDQRAAYQALVNQGQKPKVAIFACSDSRVDPAIVLQADPGDLFIVRNVANLVPPHERAGHFHGTSAALEFAVTGLGVDHIIIIGHAHCGGIAAMVRKQESGVVGGTFITAWTDRCARRANAPWQPIRGLRATRCWAPRNVSPCGCLSTT